MTSSRALLIPQKRPLLPPTNRAISNSTGTNDPRPVLKTLNPSAVAAETRMKKPSHYNLDSDDSADEMTREGDERDNQGEEEENGPATIRFSFATPPQPFLDPPTWEAMLKKRARDAAQTSKGGTSRKDENDDAGPSETADQRRQRREREAEYGSMAIRGRSNISGRGKRARGRRRV